MRTAANHREARWGKLVDDVVGKFREELLAGMESVRPSELEPEQFRVFLTTLRALTHEVGRTLLERMLPQLEDTADVVLRDGQEHRFKLDSRKDWCTPFGLIQVSRRYYQPDVGGKGFSPLDQKCGMEHRFLTPDLEEIVAFSAAHLVPSEIHTLLGKLLPQPPSVSAIQAVIGEVGSFADDYEPEVEQAISQEAPLSLDGDVLAFSWDGVMVGLREKGTLPGRPADRPGIRDGNESPTAWKEASVATISIYRQENKDPPKRVDYRHLARMPEAGMAGLLDRLETQVRDMVKHRTFREVAVICDGKPAIWKMVERFELFAAAVPILDFYHATAHLSKAAMAIFGRREDRAARWFAKYRTRLRDSPRGIHAVLDSLRYYLGTLPKNSERFRGVNRIIAYFRKHSGKMDYAGYRARGLPIGSGPVEAACKTVVNARLKRSGMRWSRKGGQHVLNLRVHVLSKRWDTFWSTYEALRAA